MLLSISHERCPIKYLSLIFVVAIHFYGCKQNDAVFPFAASSKWSEAQALTWQQEHGWLVGCNFIPSSAINQLEMWQEDTWDPSTIDRELGWASSIGMNALRVYLHDLVWAQDSVKFIQRIESFLALAQKHDLSVMLVIFDGVWQPNPIPGKQMEPRSRIHNSGWVQSPGHPALIDTASWYRLEGYVKGLITHFRNDKRIHAWDLFNEPDNSVHEMSPQDKLRLSFSLMRKAFVWAREAGNTQPLTVAVWRDQWQRDSLSDFNRFILDESDIISFHAYSQPDDAYLQIEELKKYGRPLYCSEYLARGNNNTFYTMLPYFKKHNIAAINWGLVDGKTNTIYPWDSWSKEYTDEPVPWHHDIFRADGSSYDTTETQFIRQLTTP